MQTDTGGTRRDKLVTLSIVLALIVGVLGAKSWGKSGRPTASSRSADAVTSFVPDGRAVLLFFNGVHGKCESERREFESAERSFAGIPDELLARFLVQRVNIEQPSELVHEYQVLFPPTVILLDAHGEEVYRQEWGVYGETLMEQMVEMLDGEDGGGT